MIMPETDPRLLRPKRPRITQPSTRATDAPCMWATWIGAIVEPIPRWGTIVRVIPIAWGANPPKRPSVNGGGSSYQTDLAEVIEANSTTIMNSEH